MPRVFVIVLDGVGVGEMPDAHLYADTGSNTLGNLGRAVGGLNLPVLESLGLGRIIPIEGVAPVASPKASWGKAAELSMGKDTITGHWEMMGIVSKTAFPTYPQGFPQEVIEAFEARIKRRGLWYKTASGTEILERLGPEHMCTGSPIVYTSADSVFQIAAHEDIIPPEELYAICKEARAVLTPPHNVCRVIARPFTGPPFERTYRRKDFPLDPPGETLLDILSAKGIAVLNIGKIVDMFNGRGFTGGHRTAGNTDGLRRLTEMMGELKDGFVFANLVDFDMIYGHRNDTAGFARALEEFDAWLGGAMPTLHGGDYIIVTADHGLDPTTPSTDHSREYVPVLLFGPDLTPAPLGTREGFWDVGATVAEVFGVAREFGRGRSMV